MRNLILRNFQKVFLILTYHNFKPDLSPKSRLDFFHESSSQFFLRCQRITPSRKLQFWSQHDSLDSLKISKRATLIDFFRLSYSPYSVTDNLISSFKVSMVKCKFLKVIRSEKQFFDHCLRKLIIRVIQAKILFNVVDSPCSSTPF